MFYLVRLFQCLVILAGLTAAPVWQAHGDIVSNPEFKVNGLVIVWGGDISAGQTPKIGSNIEVSLVGHAPQAAQPAPRHILVPVTAELIAIEPGSPLIALAHTQRSFFVASNTAFAIDAQILNPHQFPSRELEQTRLSMSVSLKADEGEIGRAAQYPHTGGARGGVQSGGQALSDFVTRANVFTGNQKTARFAGTLAEQSVRFDIALTDQRQSDVHRPEIDPELVFTVFVP